jgi:hypothetical protein
VKIEHIRINFIENFQSDTVVLICLDKVGLLYLKKLLQNIKQKGEFIRDIPDKKKQYELIKNDFLKGFSFDADSVKWYITDEQCQELIDKLFALEILEKPSHQYVDIDFPTDTLILSFDEYKNI